MLKGLRPAIHTAHGCALAYPPLTWLHTHFMACLWHYWAKKRDLCWSIECSGLCSQSCLLGSCYTASLCPWSFFPSSQTVPVLMVNPNQTDNLSLLYRSWTSLMNSHNWPNMHLRHHTKCSSLIKWCVSLCSYYSLNWKRKRKMEKERTCALKGWLGGTAPFLSRPDSDKRSSGCELVVRGQFPHNLYLPPLNSGIGQPCQQLTTTCHHTNWAYRCWS